LRGELREERGERRRGERRVERGERRVIFSNLLSGGLGWRNDFLQDDTV
jgi:hypothetical protein